MGSVNRDYSEIRRERIVPIDEFDGLVFGVAKDLVDIVQFVGITIEREITDTDKQR